MENHCNVVEKDCHVLHVNELSLTGESELLATAMRIGTQSPARADCMQDIDLEEKWSKATKNIYVDLYARMSQWQEKTRLTCIFSTLEQSIINPCLLKIGVPTSFWMLSYLLRLTGAVRSDGDPYSRFRSSLVGNRINEGGKKCAVKVTIVSFEQQMRSRTESWKFKGVRFRSRLKWEVDSSDFDWNSPFNSPRIWVKLNFTSRICDECDSSSVKPARQENWMNLEIRKTMNFWFSFSS